MPDDPATAPVAAPGTPPVGDPPATPAPAATPSAAPAATDDLDALRRDLSETRKEAAGYRTRLKAFEDAQKTEAELTADRIKTLEERNATLEAAHRATVVRDTAQAAARKAGFWDPEVGASLVNPSDIVYDEQGTPKNMDALLAAIAKEKPRLINGAGAAPSFGGGSRGTPAEGHEMNDLIRRAAGR